MKFSEARCLSAAGIGCPEFLVVAWAFVHHEVAVVLECQPRIRMTPCVRAPRPPLHPYALVMRDPGAPGATIPTPTVDDEIPTTLHDDVLPELPLTSRG